MIPVALSTSEAFAAGFAACAHRTQVRKYTGEPYIVHCAEVASLLRLHVDHVSLHMLQAAWLHDTVEDTDVTAEQIYDVFGRNVWRMVLGLTDAAPPSLGNRTTRKAFERDRLASESAEVQTIKCCDLISNTKTIAVNDPKFAKVYLREKREILDVMGKSQETVRRIAYGILRDAEEYLASL